MRIRPEANDDLARALHLIAHQHGKQKDKAGAPYLMHLIRVAGRSTDPDEMIVALLHDIVEDTDVTLEAVAERFSPNIVHAVDLLTRRKDESYKTYCRRIRDDNGLALRVKIRDIRDNMRRDRGYYDNEMEKGRKQYYAGLAILDCKTETP